MNTYPENVDLGYQHSRIYPRCNLENSVKLKKKKEDIPWKYRREECVIYKVREIKLL